MTNDSRTARTTNCSMETTTGKTRITNDSYSNQGCCDSEEDSIMFPTGMTVPFPYENPYPQQLDLMDTMLRSLQLIHNNKHNKKDTKSRCCPVYMMESPTGTGKSLSLACSAMAWLRYMEHDDLQTKKEDTNPTTSEQQRPNSKLQQHQQVATASSTNPTTTTGINWLDDWKSPNQRQEEDQFDRIRALARESRKLLKDELVRIRSKCRSDKNVPAIRHHIIRSAVVTARTMELNNSNRQKRRRRQQQHPSKASSNDDFCLDSYKSDDDDDNDYDNRSMDDDKDNASSGTTPHKLLQGGCLDGSNALSIPSTINKHSNQQQQTSNRTPTTTIGNVQPGSGVRKIIYSARTHSQLSQFVHELKRTQWGESVRVVALGGRKALCGNHRMNQKSEYLVNEMCLDYQKGKVKPLGGLTNKRDTTSSSSSSGCPLLASRDAVDTLALYSLTHPTDIEEAAKLGDVTQTCSYYASRAALHAAEVVVLPYSMLLSQQTRAAIGLSLKEAFVIVDEAHNIPEALRSLHSCQLSLPIIQTALGQLKQYIQKYANRLAGRNIYYLGQIKKILMTFEKYLTTNNPTNDCTKNTMISTTAFLIERKLDNINLFKILRYLERTRLTQKLLGFTNMEDAGDCNEKTMDKENERNKSIEESATHNKLSKHVSAMSIVQTFLEKLTLKGNDGKIVIDWPSIGGDVQTRSNGDHNNTLIQYPTLRYVLLHPASFFDNVVQESYAMALVGGTLKPFAHVAAELLGNNECIVDEASNADRNLQNHQQHQNKVSSKFSNHYITSTFTAFTCDHVVSSSNVSLQCVARGQSGTLFDFRHHNRYTDAVCDELGRTIQRLCETVPNGIVVFLPSYSYESFLVQRWKKIRLWDKILSIKKIHREPKSSQHVESALQLYTKDATNGGGAILFSVIGGKMSEGINFSNEMARCVVVVGLPYPDITDPVLKEKMKLMDNTTTGKSKSITGQSYYQNLCMRSVNQSIGRAIRHANDYASIVLIDSRYTTDCRIWTALPDWVKRGRNGCLQKQSDHANMSHDRQIDEMQEFFARHKVKNEQTAKRK